MLIAVLLVQVYANCFADFVRLDLVYNGRVSNYFIIIYVHIFRKLTFSCHILNGKTRFNVVNKSV